MRAGVSMGSNLGLCLEHLRAAYVWLKSISNEPVVCSRIYRTHPVGCPEGTPDFWNAACEIGIAISPLELLRKMRAFERSRGRAEVYPQNAPRPIDLDLLYVEDITMHTDELVLPHPRMTQRRFVLQPLSEICPDRVLPGTSIRVQDLLNQSQGEVERLPELLEPPASSQSIKASLR